MAHRVVNSAAMATVTAPRRVARAARVLKVVSAVKAVVRKGARVPRVVSAVKVVRAPMARRVAIATSAKPTCLVLDFAGNAGRHELANPLDLLGGDFDPVERREAQRLVASGAAPNLWAALEQARLARAAKVVERQARAGDPFALFGLQVPTRSRFAAAPSSKQRAVIDALRQPRVIDDAREADVLVRELARRERADLALYSQAALLAAVGFDLLRLRTMSRREAAEHVRALASGGWRRQSTSHSAGHSVRR